MAPTLSAMTSTLAVTDFTPLVQDLGVPLVDPTSIIPFQDETERSTRVLDRVQTESVASILASVRQRQATIASATQSLEALDGFLKTENAKCQRLESYCQALVAPIRRLSPEALRRVFAFVHATEDVGQCKPSIVAQVNKYWRKIALESPRLWTTIALTLRVGQGLDKELEKVALWASRARPCPISLFIAVNIRGHDTWAEQWDIFATLANLVKDNAPQIESLVLRGDFLDSTDDEISQLFSPSLSFPLLKVLDIAFQPEDGNRDAEDISDSSPMAQELYRTQCPALERLLLENDVVVDDMPAFSWQSLKALRATMSSVDLVKFFSLPGLSLDFLDITIDDEWLVPTTPFPPLAHLTTLVLQLDEEQDDPVQAASFPPLPALRHLILNSGVFWEDDSLYDLLRTWGEQLLYLSLPDDLDIYTIQECLKLTPNIVALRIPAEDAHALPSPSEVSLPSLSQLELTIPEDWGPPVSMLDFVAKAIREEKMYSVSSISLFLCPGPDSFRNDERMVQELYNAQERLLKDSGLPTRIIWSHDFSSSTSPYFSERGMFTDWHPVDCC